MIGCKQSRGYAHGILYSAASNLDWIYDTCLKHINILVSCNVKPDVGLVALQDVIDDDISRFACVV